jgi:hypothetical protein
MKLQSVVASPSGRLSAMSLLFAAVLGFSSPNWRSDSNAARVYGMECPTLNGAADTTIGQVKDALSSTDPADSAYRVELGLVGVDSSALVIVADSLICGRVTAVVDSARRQPLSAVSYFVLRAGPRYIAFPHLIPVFREKYFLDTAFTFLFASD